MTERIGLELLLQDKNFQSGLAKMIQAMNQAGTEAEGAGKKVQTSWETALGVFKGQMITRAVDTVVGGLKSLTVEALPLEAVAKAFEGITQASTTALSSLRAGSSGMVRDIDLMKSYNSAAQLVSKTFADQLPSAMGYLSKVSAATGQDMGFMIDSLVKGVGRLSPMILDNLGVQVNMTEANEKYAASVGKSTEELTKAEQQTAMMNLVLEKLAKNTASMPNVTGSAAQQWAAFNTTIQNLRDQVGVALIPLMGQLTTSLQAIVNVVVENKDTIALLAQTIGSMLVGAVQTALSVVKPFLEWIIQADPASVKASASFGVLVVGVGTIAAAAIAAAPALATFWAAATGPVGLAVAALAAFTLAIMKAGMDLEALTNKANAARLSVQQTEGAIEVAKYATAGAASSYIAYAAAQNEASNAGRQLTTVSLAAVNAMTALEQAQLGTSRSSEQVVTAMQTAQMAIQTSQASIGSWVIALPGQMALATSGMTTFVTSFAAQTAQMGQLLGQTMQAQLQAQAQYESNLTQIRAQAGQQALASAQQYQTQMVNLQQQNVAKIQQLEMAAGKARTDQQKQEAAARLAQGKAEADQSVAQLTQQYNYEQTLAKWNTQVKEAELRLAYAKEQMLARETALAKVAIQNTSSKAELAILSSTLGVRSNALIQSALFEREVAEWKLENDRVKGESEEAFTVRMGMAIKTRIESIFGEIGALQDYQNALNALYAGKPIEPPEMPPLPALPNFDTPSMAGAVGDATARVERTAEEVLSSSMDAIAGAFDKAIETLTKLVGFKPVQVEEKIKWLIDWIRGVQEQMWDLLQTASARDARGGGHDWLEVSRNTAEQGRLMAEALSGLTAGMDLAIKASAYKGGSVADKLRTLVKDLGAAQEEIWRLSDTYAKQGHTWMALEGTAAQGGKALGEAIAPLTAGLDLMLKLKSYSGVALTVITRFIDDLMSLSDYMAQKMPTISSEVLTAAETFKTFGGSAFATFSSGFDMLNKLAGGYKPIKDLGAVFDLVLTDLRTISAKFVKYFQLWDEGTISRVETAGTRADLWSKMFAPIKALQEALAGFTGTSADVASKIDTMISAARIASTKLVAYFKIWDEGTFANVSRATGAAETWTKLFAPIKMMQEALSGILGEQTWGNVNARIDSAILAARQVSIKLVQYFKLWWEETFTNVGNAATAATAWSKLFEPIVKIQEAITALAKGFTFRSLGALIDSMIAAGRQISIKLVKYFSIWTEGTFANVDKAGRAAEAWNKMFSPIKTIVESIKAMMELPLLKQADFAGLSRRLADYAIAFVAALDEGVKKMGGTISSGVVQFSEEAGKVFEMAGSAMTFLTSLSKFKPQAAKFQVFVSMINFMLDELEVLAELHPAEGLLPITSLAAAIDPTFQAMNTAAEWMEKMGDLRIPAKGTITAFFTALGQVFAGMQTMLSSASAMSLPAAGMTTTGGGATPMTLPGSLARPSGAPLPSETTVNVNFLYSGKLIGNISGRLGATLTTSVDAGIILAQGGIA